MEKNTFFRKNNSLNMSSERTQEENNENIKHMNLKITVLMNGWINI